MVAQRTVLLHLLPSLVTAYFLPHISAMENHLSSYLHRPVEAAGVHEAGGAVEDEVRVVFAAVVAVDAVDCIEEMAVALDAVVVAEGSSDQVPHRTEGLEVEHPVHCTLHTLLDRRSVRSWKEEKTPLGRLSLGSRAVPLGLPIILHSMVSGHQTPKLPAKKISY